MPKELGLVLFVPFLRSPSALLSVLNGPTLRVGDSKVCVEMTLNRDKSIYEWPSGPVWKVRHFLTRSWVCTKKSKCEVCNGYQMCPSSVHILKLSNKKCLKVFKRLVDSLFHISIHNCTLSLLFFQIFSISISSYAVLAYPVIMIS